MLDEQFAKEDGAEAFYMEAVALATYARAIGFHFSYTRANERSLLPLRGQGVASLKRIVCYFPEFALFIKGFPRVLVRRDGLEEFEI